MSRLIETVYTCTNAKCGHTQTITDFAEQRILPVTCCVKCRAGFGKELEEMLARHIGMFPGESVEVIEDARKPVDLMA